MIDSARVTSRRKISERKIASFERQYRTTLVQLRRDGLPDDASMEMHEDFVEWSGWQATQEEAVSQLSQENREPAAEFTPAEILDAIRRSLPR